VEQTGSRSCRQGLAASEAECSRDTCSNLGERNRSGVDLRAIDESRDKLSQATIRAGLWTEPGDRVRQAESSSGRRKNMH